MGHDGVGPCPARQPGVVRACGDDDERQVVQQIIFQLFGKAESPARRRLAVEHGQIDRSRGDRLER